MEEMELVEILLIGKLVEKEWPVITRFQSKRIKILRGNCRQPEDCHLTVLAYEEGSVGMINAEKAKTLLRTTNS